MDTQILKNRSYANLATFLTNNEWVEKKLLKNKIWLLILHVVTRKKHNFVLYIARCKVNSFVAW